ncbi:MAG: xanthine dehydrogenase family protein molybdopterin-binding subunit [Planctomycetes bacterium]|nr:xanthine dehydrogenase family protein molybdopterin-binding subunit [Planctomycetota bacterium]
MAEYSWPVREKSTVIGKSHDRLDGLAKATGSAKYTYDVNLKNQLIARALGCPLGHCRITSLDKSAAEKVPGVVHIDVLRDKGTEIEWEGELIAVVAAESEAAAAEGVKTIKVDYERLDIFVGDSDLAAAEKAGRTSPGGGKAQTEKEPGANEDEDAFVEKEIERLLKESAHVVEAYYGIDAITHCCLEPHGATVEWRDGKLLAYLSTQNVSATDDGFAREFNITADDVEIRCEYIGGGFGSKFAVDYWNLSAARIAKATNRPVKFMLTRDQELKLAGNRPSGFLKVRLGANADGVIQVWDSEHWGTGGATGPAVSQTVIPYVLVPKNYRRKAVNIKVNAVQARAWRAPNHPQACALSQTAIDDLARVMGKDSYDLFLANLVNASNGKADVYREQMAIGAERIGWKRNYHPHGKGPRKGSVVEGLGMALHTWGGGAHSSSCALKIRPDGSIESHCGTQDLGTGTRTVCAMVVAETFGLGVNDVSIRIGSSKYPVSGPSGGSTTVGGVSESHRRAATDALAKIFEKAAPKLGVEPGALEAVGGRIQVVGNASKGMAWKEACALLGMKPLEVTGSFERGTKTALSSQEVGGIQMAHVAVDTETGVVRMRKFVAVQDQGLIINPKACESQIFGAVTMGIAAALFEQRLLDPETGAFVNAELADYKLPRLGDIGEIIVVLHEPDSERSRGVIGNGEPPAISPIAAISNAICNAIGVRVPVAPYTPDRVLKALQGRA